MQKSSSILLEKLFGKGWRRFIWELHAPFSSYALLFYLLLIPLLYFLILAFVFCFWHFFRGYHRAEKVLSDSPGLVYFAFGLVNSVLNLPDGQVEIFEDVKLRKICVINPAHQNVFGASWNEFWASTCHLQLARMASCKTDFRCTLGMYVCTGCTGSYVRVYM